MDLDMYAREKRGTRAGVSLREDRFDVVTQLLGCRSEVARAQLLDVDTKTIYRARRGVIGGELIAKTLLTLREHAEQLAEYNIGTRFEDVFEVAYEVADKSAETAAAA